MNTDAGASNYHPEPSETMSNTDMRMLTEKPGATSSGIIWLLADLGAVILAIAAAVLGGVTGSPAWWIVFVVLLIAALIVLMGMYIIKPNEAAVLTLFGDYRGTDRQPGLRIANPLFVKSKISLRVRNFTTSTSKVNDANGNPIHIAAVVVWRVVDTAAARFGVDDFVDYVRIQSESAVRQMARAYPYDSFENSGETTLIGEPQQVNEDLLVALQERANAAGVAIMESRITDLSYAAEVAEAMLRRQQAAAIVAGRAKIVDGAVGMVKQALRSLNEGTDDAEQVRLEGDRRAAFAANLMTVIASDSPTNPVVNVGSDTENG